MNGVVGKISHSSATNAVEIQDTLKKLKETESRCTTSSTKLTVLLEYFFHGSVQQVCPSSKFLNFILKISLNCIINLSYLVES